MAIKNSDESQTSPELSDKEYSDYINRFGFMAARITMDLEKLENYYERGTYLLMRSAEFYDADWCGFVVLNRDEDNWSPFWWYSKNLGAMGDTRLLNQEYDLRYESWLGMFRRQEPVLVNDVEECRDSFPDEYRLYKALDVRNFMALPRQEPVPGFLILKNVKRHQSHVEFMTYIAQMLMPFVKEQIAINNLPMTESEMEEPLEENAEPGEVVIRLFNRIRITCGDVVYGEEKLTHKIGLQILLYLLTGPDEFIHNQDIIEHVQVANTSTTPSVALRNNIQRINDDLRKCVKASIIVGKKNAGYRINPSLKITTDFGLFREQEILLNSVSDPDARVKALCHLVNLYRGPFCYAFENESYIFPENASFHNRYVCCMKELLERLNKTGDLVRLCGYAKRAVEIDPDEPVFIKWHYIALKKSGQTRSAKRILNRLRRDLDAKAYEDFEKKVKKMME